MRLKDLSKILRDQKDFQSYIEIYKGGSAEQFVHGLTESQKSYWLAATAQEVRQPMLIITENIADAKNMVVNLLNFFDEKQVDFLPPRETMFHEVYAKSYELTQERIKVLTKLTRGSLKRLVITAETLMQKLLPKDVFINAHLQINQGAEYQHEELIEKLAFLGYERVDLVEGPGQFSVRGDILDIFTPGISSPLRIEFFDDEVEAIRYFDPVTQRSRGNTAGFVVSPAREILINASNRDLAVHKLRLFGDDYVEKLASKGKRSSARKLKDQLGEWLGYLQDGLWMDDLEKLQPFLYDKQDSIIDYFCSVPMIVVSEPLRVFEVLLKKEEEKAANLTELLDMGKAIPEFIDIDYTHLQTRELIADKKVLYLSSLPREIPGAKLINILSFSGKSVPLFHGKMGILKDELNAWKKRGYTVALTVSSLERAKRLREYFWEENVELPVIKDIFNPEELLGRAFIILGNFSSGFEIPNLKLAVISEEEIFGRKKHTKVLRNFKNGTHITHHGELKPGDYVVHVHHGIGRYIGLEQLSVGGVSRDYLNIQYHGQDRLYVTTDQVKLIQKYVGAEGHKPKLNKLGGSEWQKVKARVKESVQDMAKQLLELYAARETVPGHAFVPDDAMQALFEETFPYVETPDQARAIEEVKSDMIKPKPMDRLLCGDVGYGKTEVALRAAFKAVQDSKQVVVLVPTTVLAQQHYKTFTERFEDFPVRIDMLSRFRTSREQKVIVDALKKGTVDIVIGTHRLLSKDVSFKDLGLLIVDEEQRFGVAHKEKIKQISRNVDVLTLTATPIPRTLHMAMAGVRDMSVIETPPEDRYPVQTYVIEYSENLIKEAVRKELDRGGQVYFLHNRVEDIDRVKLQLQRIFPDASIGVAHGKMREDELERVMLRFIDGEYQILLCTTIVENGLDIPNVNTLIVDEADKLGLSQLYQIRGRVGRTNRIAYAYFTYRKNKVLNQQAEKRLAAIREFTEFGSGFKIAKRDLELRGAGNILGPEQHGHMLAIGFDLYCKLLEDSVKQLKGAVPAKREEETMDIEVHVSAFISNKYVPDSSQIMDIYQELGACETVEEVASIEESLIDRFGAMPVATMNLLKLTRIKVMAKQFNVIKIKHLGQEIDIIFRPDFIIKGEKLLDLARGMDRRLSFSVANGLVIKVRVTKLNQEEILDLLENIFQRLSSLEVQGQH